MGNSGTGEKSSPFIKGSQEIISKFMHQEIVIILFRSTEAKDRKNNKKIRNKKG